MEDAGHDLPAHQVGRPAQHRAILHLRPGRVGQQRGRALIGVGGPGQLGAARGSVEGPGKDVGLGEGVHPAGDVSGLGLGDAVDHLLLVKANWFIWREIKVS